MRTIVYTCLSFLLINVPGLALETRAPGRVIIASQQPRSLDFDADPRNFNDWKRAESATNVNPPEVSGDGRSVTFTRSESGDSVLARDYLEFTFGPRFAGTRLSVTMEVTGYAASETGSYGQSLQVLGNGLSGPVTRQATGTGIWSTVLDVASSSAETIVRVGLGVVEGDSRIDTITIRNVQVSYLSPDDDEPNEYVDSNGWLARPAFNGASLPYAKNVNYDPATGRTVFSGNGGLESSSPAHVMMITDSYGAFLSSFTKELFFGGYNDLPPEYVMTLDARAGRRLEDTSDGELLEQMYAIRAHANASQPGVLIVHLGVNSFLLGEGTTAESADAEIQKYIDFARGKGMDIILTTVTPFHGAELWSPWKAEEAERYNALIRQRANAEDIRLVDLNRLLDADGDKAIDPAYLTSGKDYIHAVGANANALHLAAYDSAIRQVISARADKTVRAHIKASRLSGVSPLTVVFSAEESTADGMNEHEIWRELIYHWDFDTDEEDPHGHLYDQTYTFVEGDTSHEIGGPLVTKTFFCESGTSTYRVGVRAQNEHGEYDDAFVTVTVRAESEVWAPPQTICVSNTLDPAEDWTSFDKPCPDGAVKMNVMPDAEDYGGHLVLIRKGDAFVQNVATVLGESDFKIGTFGNEVDGKPVIEGSLTIGTPRYNGPSNAPTFATTLISDADLAGTTWPENITVEGIKLGNISLPMSYQHIGFHDINMDWEESEKAFGTISIASSNSYCTREPTLLDCRNVPFPKGCYLSKIKVVGSKEAEVNHVALNVSAIGIGMVNYTGIVDCSFRKAGEHNIRIMGWWRLNIMRSAVLGQHYTNAKQKITTRASGTFLRGAWKNATDLPPHWERDPEGRTRADAFLDNGTDQYIHVSRYLVVQGNQIGSDYLGSTYPSTKFQTNAIAEDAYLVQDVLLTKNHFIDEPGYDTYDISLVGYYTACIDNMFSGTDISCYPTTADGKMG